MGSDETSGARPAGPVALRIKLRYDDVESMVQRFASNVGRAGLFLPTRSLQPVGTEIKFELRISNDQPVLVGLGRVKSVKAPDPANPKAAFGMAIELMRVTREGRDVIIRLIERRRQLGLPEVAIPMPEDVDAAKRADVDTQPVPRAAFVAPTSEGLLTSPRSTASGIATAVASPSVADRSVPVLAPEPARARRPRLEELVALAAERSGPVIAAMTSGVAELGELDDMDVDVGKALARARVLAGAGRGNGDADAELDALAELSAAPIEISVEAASAELARQLGGVAISRKDRSKGWAPPPAVVTVVVPEPVVEAAPEPEVRARAEPSPHEIVPPPPDGFEVKRESDPVIEIIRDADSQPVLASRDSEPAIEALPEQIIDIASAPVAAGPEDDDDDALIPDDPHAIKTDPAFAGIAHQRTLAIEDDADFRSFENALDAARIHTGVSQVAPAPDDDIPELDDADLQPEEELFGESTQIGAFPSVVTQVSRVPIRAPSAPPVPPVPPQQAYGAPEHLDGDGDGDGEEISDVDVLAEADADDDDLLGSNGERDSSTFAAVSPDDLPPELQYAAQQYADPQYAHHDAPGDHAGHYAPVVDESAPVERVDAGDPYTDEIAAAAAAAAAHVVSSLADEDESEGLYTPPPRPMPGYRAAPPDAATRIESHGDFADRLQLDDEDEIAGAYAHRARAMPLPPPEIPPEVPPPRDSDLEQALSALAVDLDFQADPAGDPDDPHDPHTGPRARTPSRPRTRRGLPGMPPARRWPEAPTPAPRPARVLPADDDGIIVEFDDDDDK